MIKINDSKIKQTLKRVFREDAKCVSFLLDILKHMKECPDSFYVSESLKKTPYVPRYLIQYL